MPKIRIKSANRTQQKNVITKCQQWGAIARDGNYGPVEGKTAVVINTQLGAGASLLLSNLNFSPTKHPYTKELSYKDFMNLAICPWDSSQAADSDDKASDTAQAHPEAQAVRTVIKEVPVPVAVIVEKEVGVCAQNTLKVASCDVLTQEAVGWKTLGLPYLKEAGLDVTMAEGVPYIVNTAKNSAKTLTAKSAAKKAKKDLLAGKGSAWVSYAKAFDLFENVVLAKSVKNQD